MTSQADNREALKGVLNVIMPKYLFEFKGFMMNLVNLIQNNYSINNKKGFGNSACYVTGSCPIPPTRSGFKEGLSYYWVCLSNRIKYHNKT